MEVIKTIEAMKEFSSQARRAGKTIAFVPTMGFFHQGHLSLMREGRRRGHLLIISLFVNPTQLARAKISKVIQQILERTERWQRKWGSMSFSLQG